MPKSIARWPTGITPIQWNLASSRANVLRGLHEHVSHSDYLMCVSGEMLLGLTIPPGVAHGSFFAPPAKHLYSVSHYWNVHDELGCRWDDPAIGIDWGTVDSELSRRNQEAGSFDTVAAYLAKRPVLAEAKPSWACSSAESALEPGSERR